MNGETPRYGWNQGTQHDIWFVPEFCLRLPIMFVWLVNLHLDAPAARPYIRIDLLNIYERHRVCGGRSSNSKIAGSEVRELGCLFVQAGATSVGRMGIP